MLRLLLPLLLVASAATAQRRIDLGRVQTPGYAEDLRLVRAADSSLIGFQESNVWDRDRTRKVRSFVLRPEAPDDDYEIYKDGKLFLKTGLRNGSFDGRWVVHQSDGSRSEGFHRNGKADSISSYYDSAGHLVWHNLIGGHSPIVIYYRADGTITAVTYEMGSSGMLTDSFSTSGTIRSYEAKGFIDELGPVIPEFISVNSGGLTTEEAYDHGHRMMSLPNEKLEVQYSKQKITGWKLFHRNGTDDWKLLAAWGLGKSPG